MLLLFTEALRCLLEEPMLGLVLDFYGISAKSIFIFIDRFIKRDTYLKDRKLNRY